MLLGSDFVGGSSNLTFTEANVQFVNISILDDQLVEMTEQIKLFLTPLIPGRIFSDNEYTVIEIFDNDCEFIST